MGGERNYFNMYRNMLSIGEASILRTDGSQESPALRLLAAVGAVVGFALLTVLAAQARIPLPWTPVPVTLQTFTVLLAGAVLGARLGGLSQALYLAAGLAGVPVFAGWTGGAGHLIGPTGGYLAGFVLAPLVVGGMIGRRSRPGLAWMTLSTVVGSLTITATGVLFLAMFLGGDLRAALFQGFVVFAPWNLLKAFAAAAAARALLPLRPATG